MKLVPPESLTLGNYAVPNVEKNHIDISGIAKSCLANSLEMMLTVRIDRKSVV